MNSLLERVQQLWAARQPREQRLLLGAAAVLMAVALLRQLLPVAAALYSQQQQIGELREEISWLQEQLAERKSLPADCQPLLAGSASGRHGWQSLVEFAASRAIVLKADSVEPSQWQARASTGDALIHLLLSASSCAGVELIAASIGRVGAAQTSAAVPEYIASFTVRAPQPEADDHE